MPCFDPRDVIFVTNKWDTIPKEESNSEEEDEETKTWKNIRTEIKAIWPAVKEEYIFKMNLRDVHKITSYCLEKLNPSFISLSLSLSLSLSQVGI